MEALLKSVLSKIKPTETEERKIMGEVTRLTALAEDVMPEGVKVTLVGSLAKGTWLKGSTDIDLFCLFEPDYKLEDALPLFEKMAKKIGGKTELLYAQHPYLRVTFESDGEKYEADFVPGYNVPPTNIKSAVDRSPYHTEFVNENLVTPDDVRLLKKFAKGIGVYGADMVHEGFSGYLCELLVIKYGSFLKVLEAASKWTVPQKLEEISFTSALVMSDPVDPNRNVSASISERTLKRFIRASKEFLANHSEKFFFPKKAPKTDFEKLDELIVIKVEHEKVSADIIASQVRALMHTCVNRLNRYGFHVERAEMFDGAFALILRVMELPREYIHNGPPVKFAKNVEVFKEKWPKAYEEEGRLKVKATRKFTKAKDYITHLLSNLPKYVTKAEITETPNNLRGNVAAFVEDIPSWRF